MKLSLIYLLVFLMTSSATWADSSDLYGCKDKIINVSLYDLGLFFSEKKNSGIDKDIIELLQKKSGCHFDISTKPRARIWKELESGIGTDIGTSGISNPERLKFAAFADYIKSKNYVITNKNIGELKSLNDFLELSDKRTFVGVVRSFKHGENIDGFLPLVKEQNRLKEFESADRVYEAFARKEIHMMFSLNLVYPDMFIDPIIKKNSYFYDFEKLPVTHGMIFSRKSFFPKEIDNWLNLVNSLNKSGEINNIIKTHTSEDIFNMVKL